MYHSVPKAATRHWPAFGSGGDQTESCDMVRTLRAIGLMSGTSMDGIDAAVIETDGETVSAHGPFVSMPYDDDLRSSLAATIGHADSTGELVRRLTETHAGIVNNLLKENGLTPDNIDIIGFHGHTILHRPEARVTVQIGDGGLLSRLTGVDVINDFRAADVAGGGQGAPFAPLYHAALARDLERPLAVLNLGGIANVTYAGADGSLMAFDTGPGNGLIDDWAQAQGYGRMDADGALAAAGRVQENALAALLDLSYFDRPPPKSLDRLDFDPAPVRGLSAADGAATLTAFTAQSVALALRFLPQPPRRWLVCGGGRHNPSLMQSLREALQVAVDPVEAVGWRGDAIEAEAFGFLAVRSLLGLPLSLPSTTGVATPTRGGVLHKAQAA